MSAALEAYGRITGRQLLYRSETVQGRVVRGLQGRFTADDALRRILAGTGIQVRRSGANTFILSGGRTVAPAAQKKQPKGSARASATPSRASTPAKSSPDEETIVVVGSNLRRPGGTSTEVITLTRAEIERAGAGSLAEAIAGLPQNFGGTATEDTSLTSADTRSLNNSLASGVNLRGLGSDATLTLVNGRRVAGSGGKGDFTDLSLIPLLLVERVEVLPDGASAIYGSDAVGGVINVVLRKSFTGAETRVRVGASTQGGGEDVQAGQLFGLSWRSGHLIAAYDYERREKLGAWQRRFTQSADLRPFGGSDWRLFFSNPATILDVDPKTRALVPMYGVPVGQNGSNLKAQDFLPGGNFQNQLEGSDILPTQEHHVGYAAAEQELAPKVRLFAEGRFAQRKYEFDGPGAVGAFQITPINPFFVSPTGASSTIVAYSFYDELGPSHNVGRVQAWSGTAGAQVDGPAGWLAELYVNAARERTSTRSENLLNSSYVNEALGSSPDLPQTSFSTAHDGFLNLFGSGRVNSPAILDFISQGFTAERFRSQIRAANVKADGPLFALPGGKARAAIGASIRDEDFLREGESFLSGVTPVSLSRTDASRTVKAVFAEVLLPLVGDGAGSPGLRRVEVTGAVRHESYSDFGSTTNPKVSLLWEPFSGVSLIGSYGTSFRAPALRELRDRLGVSATQLPNGKGGQTPVIFLSGGNPDLQPERAKSVNASLRWVPPSVPRLTLQATYFATRFRGRIEQPALENSSLVLGSPAYAPFVQFVNPATSPADRALVLDLMSRPGSNVPSFFPPELFQAIVDGRYVNSGELFVRGFDLLASHSFPLGGGTANGSLNATYLIDYKRRLTPIAAAVDQVATIGNPTDLRARGSFGWTKGAFGYYAGVNYVHGYIDNISVPARPVGSWTTADLQLRYDGRSGPWKNISVALSIQNLFDTDPPFANRRSGHGYDATNADPLGRYISLQVTTRW
ncbi:MAG TPA: TonB-dependent receptor [Allosphingosinicella sp.]